MEPKLVKLTFKTPSTASCGGGAIAVQVPKLPLILPRHTYTIVHGMKDSAQATPSTSTCSCI